MEDDLEEYEDDDLDEYEDEDKIPNQVGGIVFSLVFAAVSLSVIVFFQMSLIFRGIGLLWGNFIVLILSSYILGRTVRDYKWILIHLLIYYGIMIVGHTIFNFLYAQSHYVFYHNYFTVFLTYLIWYMIAWACIGIPLGLLGVYMYKKRVHM